MPETQTMRTKNYKDPCRYYLVIRWCTFHARLRDLAATSSEEWSLVAHCNTTELSDPPLFVFFLIINVFIILARSLRDHDRSGFTTTYAICFESSNHAHGEVYLIHYYVIKFVSDKQQVGGFLRVLQLPAPIKLISAIKLTSAIKLKYCWKWS